MITPVMPDAKGMAVELLGADLVGVHVAGDTPPDPRFAELLPGGIVRVLRVGGTRRTGTWGGRSVQDTARLSVDCYAPGAGQASGLAQRVLDVWEELPGRRAGGGLVTQVWEETGPADRPEEPNVNVARIGMILGMSVRPPRQTS